MNIPQLGNLEKLRESIQEFLICECFAAKPKSYRWFFENRWWRWFIYILRDFVDYFRDLNLPVSRRFGYFRHRRCGERVMMNRVLVYSFDPVFHGLVFRAVEKQNAIILDVPWCPRCELPPSLVNYVLEDFCDLLRSKF